MCYTAGVLLTILVSLCYAQRNLCDGIPKELILSDNISPFALDFGSMESTFPNCVTIPKNAQNVKTIVTYANRKGIPIAVRGNGGSTAGETQSPGIVIDTYSLYEGEVQVSGEFVTVAAGVSYHALSSAVHTSTSGSLRLSFFPDFPSEVSVGGILSVGGDSSGSLKQETIADSVVSMEVVTGRGDILVLSRSGENSELFPLVLGGVGQFAIITKVTLKLVPTEPEFKTSEGIPEDTKKPACTYVSPEESVNNGTIPRMMQYVVLWNEPLQFYEDIQKLAEKKEADGIEAFVLKNDENFRKIIVGIMGEKDAECFSVLVKTLNFPYMYIAVIPDFAPFLDIDNIQQGVLVYSRALPWFPSSENDIKNNVGFGVRHIPFLENMQQFSFWENPKATWNLMLPLNSTKTRDWFTSLINYEIDDVHSRSKNVVFMIQIHIIGPRSQSSALYQFPPQEFLFHPFITGFIMKCDQQIISTTSPSPTSLLSSSPHCHRTMNFVRKFMRHLYAITLGNFFAEKPVFFPTGYAPYTWDRHFINANGTAMEWERLKMYKCKYDPRHILGQSVGIFSNIRCIGAVAQIPVFTPKSPTAPSPQESAANSVLPAVSAGILAGGFLIVILLVLIIIIIKRNTSGVVDVDVESESFQPN